MIIDIIIIVVLIFSILMGYKKGFVGMLIGIIGLILSIFLAFLLQGPISSYLYNDTSVGRSIEENVSKMIQENVAENGMVKDNEFLENIVNAENMIEQPSKIITMYILKGISFVMILIIVYMICYILQMLLNIVFNLPLLNSVNKIGGVTLGAVQIIMKIWILCAIIYFLSPIPIISNVKNIIDKSTIAKVLYENNMLVSIVKSTIKI